MQSYSNAVHCNGWSWGDSYHSWRQSDRHYHRHCPPAHWHLRRQDFISISEPLKEEILDGGYCGLIWVLGGQSNLLLHKLLFWIPRKFFPPFPRHLPNAGTKCIFSFYWHCTNSPTFSPTKCQDDRTQSASTLLVDWCWEWESTMVEAGWLVGSCIISP